MASKRNTIYEGMATRLLEKLGATDAIRTCEAIEYQLQTPVRIKLTAVDNATQLGRVFDIARVTSSRLIGRDSRFRALYEIDKHGLRFHILSATE